MLSRTYSFACWATAVDSIVFSLHIVLLAFTEVTKQPSSAIAGFTQNSEFLIHSLIASIIRWPRWYTCKVKIWVMEIFVVLLNNHRKNKRIRNRNSKEKKGCGKKKMHDDIIAFSLKYDVSKDHWIANPRCYSLWWRNILNKDNKKNSQERFFLYTIFHPISLQVILKRMV